MPMIRNVTPRRMRPALVLAALALALSSVIPATAEQTAATSIPAKLVCTSLSANPKEFPAFQLELQFTVSGRLWLLERTTSPKPGTEKFLGILSPSNTMLIVGEGKQDNGAAWSYEFSGRKSPNGITILKGSMESAVPKGSRSCSLAF